MKQYLIARSYLSIFSSHLWIVSLGKAFSFSQFFLEAPLWAHNYQTIFLIIFPDAMQCNAILTWYGDHLVWWFRSVQKTNSFLLFAIPLVFLTPACLLAKNFILPIWSPGSLIMSTNVRPKTFSCEHLFSHSPASWYLFINITVWRVISELLSNP